MRKNWLLITLPIVVAVGHLAGYASMSTEVFGRVNFLEIIFAKLLSALGFLYASWGFEPGDHLRKAWRYSAASLMMYLLSDIIAYAIDAQILPGKIGLGSRGLVLVLGNVFYVVGTWMLASTWHKAGLSFEGPGIRTFVIRLGAIAIALLMVVPGVIGGIEEFYTGKADMWSFIKIVSGLASAISLSLVAPMLLTALALRGGILFWPWIYLTLILMSWLGTDAVLAWGPKVLGLEGHIKYVIADFFRILACLYGLSAGLAQRSITSRIHQHKAGS